MAEIHHAFIKEYQKYFVNTSSEKKLPFKGQERVPENDMWSDYLDHEYL
jgi:hypothetical protein